MRELKLRAYIKDLEDYGRVISLLFGNKDEVESALVEVMYSNGSIERLDVPKENLILEQYTGLIDKNGTEIYEGDIVQIDSIDELRVGYVDLLYDQYCIVCGEDDEGRKIVAEFYYYSKPEENCKVIGNIHEDKELLERSEE